MLPASGYLNSNQYVLQAYIYFKYSIKAENKQDVMDSLEVIPQIRDKLYESFPQIFIDNRFIYSPTNIKSEEFLIDDLQNLYSIQLLHQLQIFEIPNIELIICEEMKKLFSSQFRIYEKKNKLVLFDKNSNVFQIKDNDGNTHYEMSQQYIVEIKKVGKQLVLILDCLAYYRQMDNIYQQLYYITKYEINKLRKQYVQSLHNNKIYTFKRINAEMNLLSLVKFEDRDGQVIEQSLKQYYEEKFNVKELMEEQPLVECYERKHGQRVYLIPQLSVFLCLQRQDTFNYIMSQKHQEIIRLFKIQKVGTSEKFLKSFQETIVKSKKLQNLRLKSSCVEYEAQLHPFKPLVFKQKSVEFLPSDHYVPQPYSTPHVGSRNVIFLYDSYTKFWHNMVLSELDRKLKNHQVKFSKAAISILPETQKKIIAQINQLMQEVGNQCCLLMFLLQKKEQKVLLSMLKLISAKVFKLPCVVLYQNLYNESDQSGKKEQAKFNSRLNLYVKEVLIKLNCQLWIVPDFPELFQKHPTMVAGIEATETVLAMVSTMNRHFSQYHSQIHPWPSAAHSAATMLTEALRQFEKKNCAKARIVVLFCRAEDSEQFHSLMNELYTEKALKEYEIVIVRVKVGNTKYFINKDEKDQLNREQFYAISNHLKQQFTIFIEKKKTQVYKIYKANHEEELNCALKYPLNQEAIDQLILLTLRLHQLNYTSSRNEKVSVVDMACSLKDFYEQLEEGCQIVNDSKNTLESGLHPILPFAQELSNHLFYL